MRFVGRRLEDRVQIYLMVALHKQCCDYLVTESNNSLISHPRTSDLRWDKNEFVFAIFFPLMIINFRGISDKGNNSLGFGYYKFLK